MTNEERMYNEFIMQYPEAEQHRYNLKMNVFCDIMLERAGKRKIIAISDVPHNLDKCGYKTASRWTLTNEGKTLLHS